MSKSAAIVFEQYVIDWHGIDAEELDYDYIFDVRCCFHYMGSDFEKTHPRWEIVQGMRVTEAEKYVVISQGVIKDRETGKLYMVTSADNLGGLDDDGANVNGYEEMIGDEWFIECEPAGTEVIYKPVSEAILTKPPVA